MPLATRTIACAIRESASASASASTLRYQPFAQKAAGQSAQKMGIHSVKLKIETTKVDLNVSLIAGPQGVTQDVENAAKTDIPFSAALSQLRSTRSLE